MLGFRGGLLLVLSRKCQCSRLMHTNNKVWHRQSLGNIYWAVSLRQVRMETGNRRALMISLRKLHLTNEKRELCIDLVWITSLTVRLLQAENGQKTKGSVNHGLIMILDFENSGWIRKEFIIFFWKNRKSPWHQLKVKAAAWMFRFLWPIYCLLFPQS